MQTVKVTQVVDGDTFKINLLGFELPCRIANIDTPERGKPHWKESKNYLIDLIEGKNIEIEVRNPDKQRDNRNRFVINATFQDERLDEKLVKEGIAWHYEKYSDNENLVNAENQARQNESGLWSEDFIKKHFCKKCETQRTPKKPE